jgi:hypothetical protein
MAKSLTSKYEPNNIPALEIQEGMSLKGDNDIWMSRLQQTLRWRQNYWNGDKNWNRAYDMFRGKHWRDRQEEDPSSDQLRDRITVNITQSSILDIVPFLMNSHPYFQGKARRQSKTKSVMLQTETLNYEYEQMEAIEQVKKSVYDGAICGHGIIKDGYNFELDESIKKMDGKTLVYENYIKKDSPYVKRVSPFFFLIDPTASEANLETAKWCAEIFLKTERDIVSNERYDSKVRNKIKSGYYPLLYKNSAFGIHADDPTLNNLSKETDDPALPESKLVLLYEVWDWKYGKVRTYADGVPEALLVKDWPYPWLDKFPFTKFDYITLPDELYGVGIPYQIEDQQFELNRNRTYAFEHRRRFSARKYEIGPGVDEGELTRFANGEDGAMVRVKQIGSIVPIPDAPMPDDTQLVEGMIRSDVQGATGLDAVLRGQAVPARTTGVEVNTRTSVFRLKLEDRIATIDKFVLTNAKHTLQHIKGNFNKDRVVRLLGPEGEYWETLTPEMIREEIDIFMDTISAPKVDPLVDRQMAVQVWQITTSAPPGLLQIDYNALFGWMMEKFGIKDAGRFFLPAQTPTPPILENPAPPDPNKQATNGTVPTTAPVQPGLNAMLQGITQNGNPLGMQL